MSRHPRVVSFLQRALNHEFGAAQQFTLQAVQAEALGLRPFAEDLRTGAHEELGHAEAFAAGLVALGATAQPGLIRAPSIGRTQEELMRFGLATETEAVRLYSEALRFCESIGDLRHGTLFARILDDEVRHLRALEQRI